MSSRARAPGKLVLLGEYAVLDGTPALVMAVAHHVHAEIAPATGRVSSLQMIAGGESIAEFGPGKASGAALVDAVIAAGPSLPWSVWKGRLDSSAFYSGPVKLGLGSSAAALTAWAGAWWAAAGQLARIPDAGALIGLHRAFQGGVGSGLDVAAARLGGVLEYRLNGEMIPLIGSVQLPNSVGFAGIFAGTSASTTDLVGRYRVWQAAQPTQARTMRAAMTEISVAGCAAARAGDGEAFVAALADYGDCLGRLGAAMDENLVTREHWEIGQLARQFNVAYKVSGAGGGDVGIAATVDPERLAAFVSAASQHGYRVLALPVDEQGLVIEEQT